MPLLSIEFAIAFLIFFPLYWSVASRPYLQNWLLLLAGMGALGCLNLYFAVAVSVSSVITSAIAYALQNSVYRKGWLIVGITLATVNLGFFKYYDFFRPTIETATGWQLMDVLMPLGISYYTFQSIAYFVSLYRDEPVALKWHQLLLHLSFFATITAGPIFRAGNMTSVNGEHIGATVQITTLQPRTIIRPALAITLILSGIAKKWWLAGALGANWVDPVFENPLQYDAIGTLTATYGYTAQLFFDFSGYSDLVIGLAMLLGYQLPPNFFTPLTAHNIREFWNRWHISLSTWIRDYLYIPLGGNRKGFVRTQINLFIAMTLSGIWHGYGWNFLLWGALHGIALICLNLGDCLIGRRNALKNSGFIGEAIGIFFTIHFICATFIIFRTETLAEAGLIFQALFANPNPLTTDRHTLLALITLILALIATPLLRSLTTAFQCLLERLPIYLWVFPIYLALMLIIFFAPSGIPDFIYANF